MTTLSQQKCVACRRDSPRVTPEEKAALLTVIPDWRLVQEEGVDKLIREFRFPDFKGALAFTSSVGMAAEEEGHHPRLSIEWGKVVVTWWTHKIKGLHHNDFIMAAKTDELFAETGAMASQA